MTKDDPTTNTKGETSKSANGTWTCARTQNKLHSKNIELFVKQYLQLSILLIERSSQPKNPKNCT